VDAPILIPHRVLAIPAVVNGKSVTAKHNAIKMEFAVFMVVSLQFGF